MPYTQRKRNGKIYNFTRGSDGKPVGKPHGVFPNTPAGRRRALGQMRILWGTLQNETGDKAMTNKDISSANVGASIPDGDVTNAKFYKGAEVYLKSIDMFGVIRAVMPRRKGYLYHVDTTAGFTICAAGDLVHAGTKAMKALASKRAALIKLCDAAELSEDDCATMAKSLGIYAKAVGLPDRPTALAVMYQVKAAWAILRANPKAADTAKTFLKAGANMLGGLDEGEEGEEGRKVRPHDADQMQKAEGGAVGAAKALSAKIKAISAAKTITAKDQDDLLDTAEVMRAYATQSDDPEQMAALAGLEEAVFSEPDPNLEQWADRVLKMVDEYQAHVAAVAA